MRSIKTRCLSRMGGALLALASGLFLQCEISRGADFVSPGEMSWKELWAHDHLASSAADHPFSFVYGGRDSGDLLREWPKTQEAGPLEPAVTRQTTTWTNPATGLEVRCVAVEYTDYPAVEWTVYFKNNGTRATPILEQILGIDMALERPAAGGVRSAPLEGRHVRP